MLAKKDGKDESTDKKEEVKESNINEDKVSNGTVSTLEKGIQRILGTEVNHADGAQRMMCRVRCYDGGECTVCDGARGKDREKKLASHPRIQASPIGGTR